VSHEFRTPLTLIQASLDDLGRRDPDAPPLIRARSYLDRLVRLVDQLLDLSALQADRLREPVLPWSLSAVLGFMIRSFEPLARKRGIQFTSDLEAHCVTACSQHHVEQIALNLISNALKYSPRGADVNVSLSAEEDGLVLTVSDTGPGIDPSEHEAVFERFHRAQEAQASGQDGAGIGLALVRETVEALGGSIELDSEPGRGSAFRVVLPGERLPDLIVQAPAVDARALDREVAQLSMLPVPAEPLPTQNEDAEDLLLLVEDQPEIRTHLAEVLAEDWRVIDAADGRQGLERARQDQPDVIISDVMMPGMDGFQMLARLRDDLATSHIPVMLLTARHDRDSRMKGLMLSADDFMGKPFDVQELKVRLRRMRDNRKRLQRFLLDGGAPDLGQGEQESAPDLSARDRALLDSLNDWLEAHAEDASIKVEDMAAAVALETRTLQRKIRALTGQTPSDFIRHFRLQRAISLLLRTERSVNDIALSCGFSSPQSFSRVFSREYGQPPDRWRRTRGPTDQTSS
jgi:DNA-binding response OmpR family regulator/two-component sensor histidine kinase